MFEKIIMALMAVAVALLVILAFRQVQANRACKDIGGIPVRTDFGYYCIKGK